jgi:hypothetical protein
MFLQPLSRKPRSHETGKRTVHPRPAPRTKQSELSKKELLSPNKKFDGQKTSLTRVPAWCLKVEGPSVDSDAFAETVFFSSR